MSTETSILIRDIDTAGETRQVEQLQKEVWGIPDLEVVPLSQLIAAKTSGGVLIGAFDGPNLIGFAYGFVGHENGETVHHSHMLAVKPEYRSRDLGFRLKLAQRERVLKQGIRIMTWTFDPLQSLNAFFNFRKLGVVADRYFIDFYGFGAASFLHRNGTDRFWVTWHVATERVNAKLSGSSAIPDISQTPVLVAVAESEEPVLIDQAMAAKPDRILIEIPADIKAIEQENFDLARRWRLATRRALSDALASGYMVEDFVRQNNEGTRIGSYILRKKRYTATR